MLRTKTSSAPDLSKKLFYDLYNLNPEAALEALESRFVIMPCLPKEK